MINSRAYAWFQRGSVKLDKRVDKIHFLNVAMLRRFISPVQKILHSHFTGLKRADQAAITREIKIARMLGLLPYKF